jgi:hypothetical protein
MGRGVRCADHVPPLVFVMAAARRWPGSRRSAVVDRVDDLACIDSLEVDPAPRGAVRKEMTDESISSVLAGMPALG